jgi:hypothetical protein
MVQKDSQKLLVFKFLWSDWIEVVKKMFEFGILMNEFPESRFMQVVFVSFC